MANDDVAVYRCKSPFVFFVDRMPHSVPAGALVSASDPAYKANPDGFESVQLHIERAQQRVEQATKAPGETRATSIPKAVSTPNKGE